MKFSLRLAVVAALVSVWGPARAQQPLNPYNEAAPDQPLAQPPQPAPTAQPIDPYEQYPVEARPAPVAPAPPAPPAAPAPAPYPYPQQYYYPPAPPVYYNPSLYRPIGCSAYCTCPSYCRRPVVRKWDGVRRFSLGAHATFLALNQKVGTYDVTLGGGGFQMRLRSSGHFGFELSQSFLHGSYWSGNWERSSFPFQLSLMFYLFKNDDSRHFNIYLVGGAGLVPDTISLYDENRVKVSQDFTEVEIHGGLGAELRFHWFAIEADARYVGLWRDDSDTPASWYGSRAGAPVPTSSQAVQGNLYLSIWF